MDLLVVLAEVRRLRAENPGRGAWYDAQERCLVDLLRRLAGGDAVAMGADRLREALARSLEELVAGTALGAAMKKRIALARWRASGGLPEVVQASLWEGAASAAAGGRRARETEGPPGESEAAAALEDDTGKGTPRLMAAIGETPDGIVDDAVCLEWLAEIASGRRRWGPPAGLSAPEATLLRARLTLLLDLWRRV